MHGEIIANCIKSLEQDWPGYQYRLRRLIPITLLPWLWHCWRPRLVFNQYTRSSALYPKGEYNHHIYWVCTVCGDIELAPWGLRLWPNRETRRHL